jgi:PKHD-type hydroxylase
MAPNATTDRSCTTQSIPRSDARDALFQRLWTYFCQLNQSYGFVIDAIEEPMQLITYNPGDHIGWHIDHGRGEAARRKLSLSIQLSDEAEYDGGDIEFPDGNFHPFSRRLGASIMFPSYLFHRVTPVTRGVRRSLVVWCHGPTFK